MWLFLGSECLLFGGLISTYMLYRGRHSENLGPDQLWDIPFTSASSFVLLMSSLTMVLAVSAASRKDDRNTTLWLTVTALLGALFVAGQVYEFTTFYREGLGFTTSLFSSSFYTLTGFHGVHVSVGIIMLLSLVGMLAKQSDHRRQGRGRRDRRPLLALRRHRVDPDLHPRLPDPGLRLHRSTDMTPPTPRPTPPIHESHARRPTTAPTTTGSPTTSTSIAMILA
jgi:heme/copper-type cytochrome/quinol oxidase subunit 3